MLRANSRIQIPERKSGWEQQRMEAEYRIPNSNALHGCSKRALTEKNTERREENTESG